MPFGLSSKPATFHRALDTIQSEVSCRACPIYIAEAVIILKDNRQQVKNIGKMLKLLRQAAMTLKLSEGHFF